MLRKKVLDVAATRNVSAYLAALPYKNYMTLALGNFMSEIHIY
jgi:hypothetical protein